MPSDQNDRNDPSDAGAPPGAPRPIPPTPEVIALVLREFNEEEALAEIREIENGGGRKLEEFIGELEELARQVSEPAASRG